MKNTSIHVIPFQCPDLTNCRISAITMYLLIYFVEADDAALWRREMHVTLIELVDHLDEADHLPVFILG